MMMNKDDLGNRSKNPGPSFSKGIIDCTHMWLDQALLEQCRPILDTVKVIVLFFHTTEEKKRKKKSFTKVTEGPTNILATF